MKLSNVDMTQVIECFGKSYCKGTNENLNRINFALRNVVRERLELGEVEPCRTNLIHEMFSLIDRHFPIRDFD